MSELKPGDRAPEHGGRHGSLSDPQHPHHSPRHVVEVPDAPVEQVGEGAGQRGVVRAHGELRRVQRQAPTAGVDPPGEVGEVFSRFAGGPAQYRYLGAAALETVGDGFSSVGDLGYLDAEGYLYLADRRVDLIISGGANVVPAEVESVLTQHPAVRDAAVIGLRDDDLGRRVHAIVELAAGIDATVLPELDRHMRTLLAGYKVPRNYEVVAALPRDEAGKIRKGTLRDERGG